VEQPPSEHQGLGRRIAKLREALERNAGNADAHRLLGLIYAWQDEKSDAAVWHLRNAIGLAPGNVGWRLELANMLEKRGDQTAAIVEVEQELQLNPKSADARAWIARVQVKECPGTSYWNGAGCTTD
jgi:cytochrome c-type biogenesis protein CcmH/NrfG